MHLALAPVSIMTLSTPYFKCITYFRKTVGPGTESWQTIQSPALSQAARAAHSSLQKKGKWQNSWAVSSARGGSM